MQNSKFEDTYFHSNNHIRIGDKLMDLSKPVVMGILNITPDSFYAESRAIQEDQILSRVKDMLMHGASIIDIGGYSSRPGATDISEKEELERVIPVIEMIRSNFPDCTISLDTFRGTVAEAGINVGANIINDISGFEIDPTLLDVVSRYKVPYVLMHMRGTPQTMMNLTEYDNIVNDIVLYFSEKLETLRNAGINDVILDPGFGFSKTMEQNYMLLNSLERFRILECPLLVGVSRKGMIYKKLGVKPEEALNGTIALNAIALSKGASIIRVHDVKEAKELVDLLA